MCMNRLHYRSINLVFFFLLTVVASAQVNKISGTITDVDSGEPIPFANVFFASTSIGISSDMEGKFVLQNFPNGKYDFTVAYVGYEPFQQAFEFNGSEFRLTIKLKTEEVKLREVVIKADTTGWAQNFATFKRNFLGETENAAKCKILNPRDIHLYFDRQARVLVAHASKPIVIENKALGYTIQWYLQKFELNYVEGTLQIFGFPSFQPLTPKGNAEAKRWMRERERAYYGSVTHFIRSLGKESLTEERFRVRKFYRVPNLMRPSDEFLNRKITYFRNRAMNGEKILIGKTDSLRYYMELRNEPKLADSVATEDIKLKEILTNTSEVNYMGMLKVDFVGEREEVNYAKSQGRTTIKQQTSVIHFLVPGLKIYENGYYQNAYDVFFEWYWAWSEKLSDMLPYDYSPPTKK
jgi:hypothetical protein